MTGAMICDFLLVVVCGHFAGFPAIPSVVGFGQGLQPFHQRVARVLAQQVLVDYYILE
jgi:hypothetical protein